jgi:hypothetical protein
MAIYIRMVNFLGYLSGRCSFYVSAYMRLGFGLLKNDIVLGYFVMLLLTMLLVRSFFHTSLYNPPHSNLAFFVRQTIKRTLNPISC